MLQKTCTQSYDNELGMIVFGSGALVVNWLTRLSGSAAIGPFSFHETFHLTTRRQSNQIAIVQILAQLLSI
jgi:hypothetical protein